MRFFDNIIYFMENLEMNKRVEEMFLSISVF